MVQSNINHLNQVSAGCQKPHTTDTSVQGCWYSANVTVSGTIPTYGSDHMPYPQWSHCTAMALRSLSIIKAAIYLRQTEKQKHARDWVPRCVRGKTDWNVKEETEKKEQESSWGCVVEMFKTSPAGAFYPRLMEYVLLNRSDKQSHDCLSIYCTGPEWFFYFHYIYFHSQQKFTFDVSFSWALHSSLWDQLLQVPVSR